MNPVYEVQRVFELSGETVLLRLPRFPVIGSPSLGMRKNLRTRGNESVILTDRPPHRHMDVCQGAWSCYQ